MRRLVLASVIAVSASCVSAHDVICDNGVVCPAGSTCKEIETQTFCALPEQLEMCEVAPDRSPCMVRDVPGACHAGVCLLIECGNGLRDPDEMCDDGNTEPSDGCSADCRSDLTCRNGVLDAAEGEDCDDGNSAGHDGCAASCIAETRSWTELLAERPPTVYQTRLAFDSSRGRVVMFGGRQNLGYGVLEHTFVHEWDGARWVQMHTDVAPQPRADYQIAYDAARRVTVMFSGSTYVPDTWLWDGIRWTVASPATIPPPRSKSTMVYDSKRDRIVMFGGQIAGSPVNQVSDTWAWTGSDWMDLNPATVPPKRQSAHMAYDPKRDRIVLYGGFASAALADLWEFDGTNWAQIAFSVGPGAQYAGAMAFDPVSEHVILVPAAGGTPTDVWEWSGTTWTKRPTASAFPITIGLSNGGAITTDAIRGRVVMWVDKLYELVGSNWVAPRGGGPEDTTLAARQLGTFVLDTGHRRVIAYGGADTSGVAKDDTYVWDGGWTYVGAGPSARFGAGAAFHRARAEMVLFGGCPTATTFLGDTYTFDTTWHPLSPPTSPTARCKTMMAYDVAQDQVILFGGLAGFGPLSDTWMWDPAAGNWVAIVPAHIPPARYSAAIGYDERRKQIVMFGGHGGGSLELEDTWIWDAAARDWIQQTVATPPPHRHDAQLAWDYARARLVLYGGNDSTGVGALGDVWEWTGTTWVLTPVQDSPRLHSFGMTSGFDGGVLVFGGVTPSAATTDAVLRLRYDGPARYETCTSVDVDGDGLLGCGDTDCVATCIPCGDGLCDPGLETCGSCPADCGVCPASCGDLTCGTGEVCAGDC